MNSKKATGRRKRQKKFIQQDEQNEVGVMDDNVQFRNKIEQKQEGMFDPHQLRQNMFQFQFQQKPYDNELLSFQVQSNEKKAQKEVVEQKEQVMQKGEQPNGISINGGKKKRQRRDKKKLMDSDEQNGPEGDNKENNQEEEEKFIDQRDKQKNILQEQEEDQLNIKQILQKKNQKDNPQKYVLIHNLMKEYKKDPKKAIYKPLQKGQFSFVYFKRIAAGFSQYFQVIGEDERPILFCQNQRGCIGCNYYISLTKEMNKNSDFYLGKLRGNASGSVYQLYDYGVQPQGKEQNQSFRTNMAHIQYQDNFLGMKGPRKLKAATPKIQAYEDFNKYKLLEDKNLNQLKPSQIRRFRNKQPKWNERLKSFALNFGGRVKQASIKNFILMDDLSNASDNDEQKAPNLITFGKINQTTFALEFRSPLSLFQAFGIAMSEFDYKLTCQ